AVPAVWKLVVHQPKVRPGRYVGDEIRRDAAIKGQHGFLVHYKTTSLFGQKASLINVRMGVQSEVGVAVPAFTISFSFFGAFWPLFRAFCSFLGLGRVAVNTSSAPSGK